MVSFDSIKKGKIERPKSGLDRFTLTEIGEPVIIFSKRTDLSLKVRGANPPFPWEMAFSSRGVEVAHLNGHFIGPSTFRSIFRFRYLPGTEGEAMANHLIKVLDRDPLRSDYWDNDTWARFTNKVGSTKVEIEEQNRIALSRS